MWSPGATAAELLLGTLEQLHKPLSPTLASVIYSQ